MIDVDLCEASPLYAADKQPRVILKSLMNSDKTLWSVPLPPNKILHKTHAVMFYFCHS